tara:strand:- start:55 stop:432 length:378 start_codon:yes stop_codon:yes gene_type:complete
MIKFPIAPERRNLEEKGRCDRVVRQSAQQKTCVFDVCKEITPVFGVRTAEVESQVIRGIVQRTHGTNILVYNLIGGFGRCTDASIRLHDIHTDRNVTLTANEAITDDKGPVVLESIVHDHSLVIG